jgi:hypothetical protein
MNASNDIQLSADSRIAELEQQIANIKARRDLQLTATAQKPAFMMCDTCGTLVDDQKECDCTNLGTDTQDIVGLYRGPVDRDGLLEEMRRVIEPFARGSIDISGTAVIVGYPETRAALDTARAFLSKLEGSSNAKA